MLPLPYRFVVCYLGLMAFSCMSSLTQQAKDIPLNEDQMPWLGLESKGLCNNAGAVQCSWWTKEVKGRRLFYFQKWAHRTLATQRGKIKDRQ